MSFSVAKFILKNVQAYLEPESLDDIKTLVKDHRAALKHLFFLSFYTFTNLYHFPSNHLFLPISQPILIIKI